MKILKEERGNILILAALSMTMLLSFMAMAIDVGNLYYKQRQLQTLADAAAMAGALEIDFCAGEPNCDAMQTAAKSALLKDNKILDIGSATGAGVLLTINNPPSALAGDPNAGSKYYVEAVVTKQVPTYFAKIFGKDTVTISARAEAGKAKPSGPCIITNKLSLNSSASITSDKNSTCGIYDNGDLAQGGSSSTVDVNGSFIVNGNKTGSGGSYTPAPTSGQMVPDPIKAEIDAGTLAVPTSTGMANGTSTTSNGVTNYTAGNWPNGITFSGTNTLAAGVYYMGSNVILNTGAVINGTGVTIYLASGGINSNGSASTINLTAPSSGPTAGMLIWEADGNSAAINLDSGSNSSFGGAIYLPSGQLTLNSAAGATSYGLIVADSVMTNEKSTIILNGSGGGGAHNGSLSIALAE